MNPDKETPLPRPEHSTLNFTLTNLRFTVDLGKLSSPKFSSTEKIMCHYVSQTHTSWLDSVHVIHLISLFWHDILNKYCSSPDWPSTPKEQHWHRLYWMQSSGFQVRGMLREGLVPYFSKELLPLPVLYINIQHSHFSRLWNICLVGMDNFINVP